LKIIRAIARVPAKDETPVTPGGHQSRAGGTGGARTGECAGSGRSAQKTEGKKPEEKKEKQRGRSKEGRRSNGRAGDRLRSDTLSQPNEEIAAERSHGQAGG